MFYSSISEVEEALFWASHVENLLSRSNKIDVSVEDSQGGDLEGQGSSQFKKLLYVVDSFPELQHQIELLSNEKEELHTALADQSEFLSDQKEKLQTYLTYQIQLLSHEKEELQTALTDQSHEIEHLKERVQESLGHEQELAVVRRKIINMESGLDGLIQKFSNRDMTGDQKSVSTDDYLQVIEKQVVSAISESENLKSKVHELELEVKKSINSNQELAKFKEQLLDLEAGVQRIIKNLGGDTTKDSSDSLQVLEKMIMAVTLECEKLKSKDHELGSEIWKHSDELELAEVKGQLVDFESGLQRFIEKLRGDAIVDQGPTDPRDILQLLEKRVMSIIMDSENSKSKVHELDSKLHGSQKAVDELLLKVKALEDSLQSRVVPPSAIQERSIFETATQPSASEISEIEDVVMSYFLAFCILCSFWFTQIIDVHELRC